MKLSQSWLTFCGRAYNRMLQDIITGTIASGIAGCILWALTAIARRLWPHILRGLTAQWDRSRAELAADYAAVQAAPLWRKVVASLALVWMVGGFAAFILAGGLNDAAPLWAVCWGVSVSLFFWGYIAWRVGATLWRITHRIWPW